MATQPRPKSAKSTKSKAKSTRKRSSSAKKRAPWDKPAPKNARHTRLSKAKKSKARAAAKRAGRRYPNLVDNMRAASGGKGRKKTGR